MIILHLLIGVTVLIRSSYASLFARSIMATFQRKTFRYLAVAFLSSAIARGPSFSSLAVATATACGLSLLFDAARTLCIPGFHHFEQQIATSVHNTTSHRGNLYYMILGMLFPAFRNFTPEVITNRALPGVSELLLTATPAVFGLAVLDASGFGHWDRWQASLWDKLRSFSSYSPRKSRGYLVVVVAGAAGLSSLYAPDWICGAVVELLVPAAAAAVFESASMVNVGSVQRPVMATMAGNLVGVVLRRLQ